MIRSSLWALAILGLLLLVQTTILSYFVVLGTKPDLLWVIFVILASQNGSFISQIVGFVLGLAIDTVTTAPLGFHAFQFSLAGYIFGLGSGKVYFDPIVMPAFLGFLVTTYQILSAFSLNTIFRLGEPWTVYFNPGALLQLVLNVLLAPVAYWLYGWVKEKFHDPHRGFGG